jgi:glycosyltransferase involved in cell wall biosynthesis
MQKERIALFHPWIKSRGGAEKVVLELLKIKNFDIDLFTWVYDKEKTFKDFENYKINVISPKIAQKISRNFLLRGLFLPISLFSKISLEKYDKFLISTSGIGEFILFRNYIRGKTFAYVHTPLRAASEDEICWNLKYRYKNVFSRLIYKFAVRIYKVLEKIAWRKIDFVIFNSEISKRRAEKNNLVNNKDSEIIYPPINFNKFRMIKNKEGDYFLYWSRLNYNKRQDKLLEMWKEFNFKDKLIIKGGIEDLDYFKKLEKLSKGLKNVQIITREDKKEDKITYLISRAKAIIFIPYKEDFGIVPFEALACGKKLIATDEGGYVDLIKKYPQVFLIKEKEIFNPKVWKEKFKELEKVKAKKIFEKEGSPKNFRKKIIKFLSKR